MQQPELPFHFVWRGLGPTESLSAALVAIETRPEDAAWHLAEGHLQTALRDQGYGVLAEGIAVAEQLDLLRERIRVALEIHRRCWAEQDDLGQAVGNLGRIFRQRGGELVERGKQRIGAWRNWLADALADRG